MTQRDPIPLVALLGRAEADFAAEFDRRVALSDMDHLSLAHSRNVLRHLTSGPMRASQVTAVADVTKQAISQQIAHLERHGYLTARPDPTDQRARLLELTEKGQRAQRTVKRLFAEIEDDWAAALGAERAAALRDALTALHDRRRGTPGGDGGG